MSNSYEQWDWGRFGWGASENLLKRPSSYYLGYREACCGSWIGLQNCRKRNVCCFKAYIKFVVIYCSSKQNLIQHVTAPVLNVLHTFFLDSYQPFIVKITKCSIERVVNMYRVTSLGKQLNQDLNPGRLIPGPGPLTTALHYPLA